MSLALLAHLLLSGSDRKICKLRLMSSMASTKFPNCSCALERLMIAFRLLLSRESALSQ